MLCVEFFMASWRSLDRFLTPLDFSRRLLACSWLISFFQESASLLKNHQEANKKTPRSCWDAAKNTKTCQEVSRSDKKKKKCQEYFWKFQNMSWSFPIDQEYWRSAKKLSRSLQEVIKNDQELKFGRILVQNSYSGTAPRWTTRI